MVEPFRDKKGWRFSQPEPNLGATYLSELYLKSDPSYSLRYTVPVLWDKEQQVIVNNESRDIMRILDHEFQDFAENSVDFCPSSMQKKIDSILDDLYEFVNNGVYRAGFAKTQKAYEEAVIQLFQALDYWENRLKKKSLFSWKHSY